MATNLLRKLGIAIASTTLSFTAMEASPAQASIWNFSFFNENGRVGHVNFDDTNLTYSSLYFRRLFPVLAQGSYKINGNLASGDFSVNFDVGLRLKVIKLYSYWQLYDANGKLIGESPHVGNGWMGCNDVTPSHSYFCVTYRIHPKT